jgi:hypothetical protein
MLADISHKGEKKEKEIQDVCGRVVVVSWGIREHSKTSGNYSHSHNRGKFCKALHKVNTCLNMLRFGAYKPNPYMLLISKLRKISLFK